MGRLRLAGLLIALALTACAGYRSLTPPDVSLSEVEVRELGLLEQRFGLRLRVTNPNDVSIDIRGVTYTVEVNGKPFAKGASEQSVTLPRFGEALLDVPATTNLSGLLKQIGEWRKGGGKEAVAYQLSGTIYPSFGPGIPFSHKGQVALPAFLQP